METVTATITAIDKAERLITMKIEDGRVETLYAGPAVERFDALKVGDKVSFRYYESVVAELKKTDEPLAGPTVTTGVVRGEGKKPSGTISAQGTAVVEITSLDASVPSLTVKTAADDEETFAVEDAKLLAGVKVGDRVSITYTAALLVKVTPPTRK